MEFPKQENQSRLPLPSLGDLPDPGIESTTLALVVGFFRASLLTQMVNNLPAMQDTQVQSLGWEDPLEEDMATPSSILAWKILWMEESGGLQSRRLQRVGHD